MYKVPFKAIIQEYRVIKTKLHMTLMDQIVHDTLSDVLIQEYRVIKAKLHMTLMDQIVHDTLSDVQTRKK